MRSMVEGCPALERVTPLRQAFGLPPPLAGEEGQNTATRRVHPTNAPKRRLK